MCVGVCGCVCVCVFLRRECAIDNNNNNNNTTNTNTSNNNSNTYNNNNNILRELDKAQKEFDGIFNMFLFQMVAIFTLCTKKKCSQIRGFVKLHYH